MKTEAYSYVSYGALNQCFLFMFEIFSMYLNVLFGLIIRIITSYLDLSHIYYQALLVAFDFGHLGSNALFVFDNNNVLKSMQRLIPQRTRATKIKLANYFAKLNESCRHISLTKAINVQVPWQLV